MNSANNTTDQQWDSYWDNDGAKGEVFVGKGGDAHPGLANWWRARFAGLTAPGDIVDLACGAGSVFKHLPTDHAHRLHGADISARALELLSEQIPGVITTVCSADQLPFEDGRFDVVCSQFGVEYAGSKAFDEAGRVLKDSGQLLIVCHIQDGYIDRRNRAHLAHAQLIETTGFIELSLALVDATYSGKRSAFDAALAAFVPAERRMASAARARREGIHWHLYVGFRQLYENRQQYDRSDIDQWLHAMRDDVRRNIARLTHMCRSASDRDDMDQVMARLAEAGLHDITCDSLTLDGHDAPVAWTLTARR